jgi:hypothetical protein
MGASSASRPLSTCGRCQGRQAELPGKVRRWGRLASERAVNVTIRYTSMALRRHNGGAVAPLNAAADVFQLLLCCAVLRCAVHGWAVLASVTSCCSVMAWVLTARWACALPHTMQAGLGSGAAMRDTSRLLPDTCRQTGRATGMLGQSIAHLQCLSCRCHG